MRQRLQQGSDKWRVITNKHQSLEQEHGKLKQQLAAGNKGRYACACVCLHASLCENVLACVCMDLCFA